MNTYQLFKDCMPYGTFQAVNLTEAIEKVKLDFENKQLNLEWLNGNHVASFSTPNRHEYQLAFWLD